MSDIRPYQIPQNFKGKFTIAGMSLEWAGVIEGAILGGIASIVMYFGITYYAQFIKLEIPFQMMMSMIIIALVVGVFFGMKGINGDPVHRYVKHVFASRFQAKKAQYNPRVKYEFTYEKKLKQRSVEVQDAGQSGNSTSMFKRYEPKLKRKKPEVEEVKKDERKVEFLFADDVGIVEKTPEEMVKTLKRRNKANKLKDKILKKFNGIGGGKSYDEEE